MKNLNYLSALFFICSAGVLFYARYYYEISSEDYLRKENKKLRVELAEKEMECARYNYLFEMLEESNDSCYIYIDSIVKTLD